MSRQVLLQLVPPIMPVASPLLGVQIHLIELPTTAAHILDEQRRALLDGPTRDRAAAFQLPRHRAAFAAAQVAARWIIAQACGVTFSDLAIRRRCRLCGSDEHGKPFVAAPVAVGTSVAFSLSHTDGAALVAVAAPEIEVGIDVERRIAAERISDLGASILHPDESEALAVDGGDAPKADALLRLWVRKEAVLKATGHGLGISLNHLKVASPQDRQTTVVVDSAQVFVSDLRLPTKIVGAVAATPKSGP